MCGIVGHINFVNSPSVEQIQNCVYNIRHRGPDNEGLWISPGGQIVLGHTRLSIIDLSSSAHQPMLDPYTGNCIVYNGEIYNFKSLRQYCETLGEKFYTYSDTEVILAMYRRHGIECLHRLRGMFAFALWDENKKCLFIARDRYGQKPINYYQSGNDLIFCSELAPLSKHPEVTTELDNESLELYLQLGYIPAPWTIYNKIKKLPPAHFAVFNKSGLTIKRYWDIDYREKVKLSMDEAIDALEEKLTEAIKLRMISDVPVGALLSGGVDSSIVVALMSKISNVPVNTYSIGFTYEAFNELSYANHAAAICRTNHYTQTLNGSVEAILPKLIKHYGEPFADSSAVPSFFVCEAARKHVKVALTGDGGDELLGGYSRNWLSPLQLRTASLTPNLISPTNLIKLSSLLSEVENMPLKVVRKLIRDYAWPELSVIPTRNEFWNNKGRTDLMQKKINKNLIVNWLCTWYCKSTERANDPIDRMLYFESNTMLPGDLLTKMDIASMCHGLELRSPMIDHEVIEFCAQLPYAFKVNNRIGKYLLKRLAEKYFPSTLVHRHKMGFRIPLHEWLTTDLKNSLNETLLDRNAMHPLNHKIITQTLDEFLRGNVEHASRIWALFMYGLWVKFSKE